MTIKKLKVVHYLNQFFGGIGGEDKANTGFKVKEGPVGPGLALQKELGDRAEVVATLICGDNYFSRYPKENGEEGCKLIEPYQPDLFFAGPAFEAGRYGVSCGGISKAVAEKFGIPVITAMHEYNPGVGIYQKYAFICKTGMSARELPIVMKKMTRLAFELVSDKKRLYLVSRENLPKPDEFEYYSRLIMRNEYTDKTPAQRSIDNLLAKLKGETFETEVIGSKIEKVEPALPIKDPSTCEIAIATDGGLVPKGNPDKLTTKLNERWAIYELDSFLPEDFNSSDYDIMHSGYFTVEVMENPNRLVPVDAVRDLVKEGKIGKLHESFFCTSGGVSNPARCTEMGDEFGEEIKKRGIDAVILTST